MRMIYLDYNATTPIAPAAQEAMLPFLAEHYGEPSSGHPLGRAAREAIEDARHRVADLIGAASGEIVFTSGGTESVHAALLGALLRQPDALRTAHAQPGSRPHLVISALEHPAVSETAAFLERLGVELTVVPCNRAGIIEPAAIEDALRRETVLVSVLHASGEIGAIQPVAEIARVCKARGVLVHTDAAQSAGKIATQVDTLGVDLLSLSGHKLYAPKGTGALYVRRGVALEPWLHGGGQESGLRAGTENTAGIVALGQAVALATVHLEESERRLTALRDRLLAALRAGVGAGLAVNAESAPRLPNTLSVRFPGVTAAAILDRATEVCASDGAATTRGRSLSPTLALLGLNPDEARGTLRLSVGWYTTDDDVDRAASLLVEAWEALYKPASR